MAANRRTTPDGTAFEVAGPADAPAVVLIHGLGLSREMWTAHVPLLADRFRVVTYDLFGHGESAPAPTSPVNLAVFAAQIVGLLDKLGVDRAHIVGFSIGGMINRRLALDHPERVTSLVIVNSPHDRGEEAQAAVETRAQSVLADGAMATMDAALVRWFTPGHLDEHPEHEEAVRRWRSNAEPQGYAEAAWVLANGVRELIAPVPALSVPTLVMTGENDSGSTPAMSHLIAAEIAGAETIIVDDLQHLGILEQPKRFIDPIRRFLTEHS